MLGLALQIAVRFKSDLRTAYNSSFNQYDSHFIALLPSTSINMKYSNSGRELSQFDRTCDDWTIRLKTPVTLATAQKNCQPTSGISGSLCSNYAGSIPAQVCAYAPVDVSNTACVDQVFNTWQLVCPKRNKDLASFCRGGGGFERTNYTSPCWVLQACTSDSDCNAVDPPFGPSDLKKCYECCELCYDDCASRVGDWYAAKGDTNCDPCPPICGDQLVTGAEQCDGTMSCLSNCTCAAGTLIQNGLCVDVCGNGVVTGAEQCDSTYGCTSECKCKAGMKIVNGRCLDVCGNGVVSGTEQCDGGSFCDKCKCVDGYKPTSPLSTSCEVIPAEFVPRVNPSLDCLDVLDNNTVKLYLSYNNIEGFELTISYGKYNSFSPANAATTRPTVFSAGQSLTFPLSPYITNFTITSTSSFSWLLGSFNLTVDLSNPTRFQCPKAPSLEIELSTSVNLTNNDVQVIIGNIAEIYDIDPSRINVTVVVTSTQPPTYVLIITIYGPTNATEKDTNSVFIDLFNDLKENSDDTKQDLTKGLEDIEPVIKQINTRPTGVEVRGQPTNNGEFTPISATLSRARRGLELTLGLFLVSAVVALML